MPWKQGQSGNPQGRPKTKKTVAAEIEKLLKRRVDKDGKKITRRQAIAEIVTKMALDGDIQALKLLMNYNDGMPIQKTEISGPDQGAIVLVRDDKDEA